MTAPRPRQRKTLLFPCQAKEFLRYCRMLVPEAVGAANFSGPFANPRIGNPTPGNPRSPTGEDSAGRLRLLRSGRTLAGLAGNTPADRHGVVKSGQIDAFEYLLVPFGPGARAAQPLG